MKPAMLLVFSIATACAVDPANPGHSAHGESFDEGPRRFAVLMGGTGNVHFPVTTSSAEAQRFFDQGIGQLHGFWYFEAERSFRQVLHLDPDCIMAYWGMAMANVENEPRARKLIGKAAAGIGKASEKEKLWIRSLEKFHGEKKDDGARKAAAQQLVRDWEEIAAKYPDDVEARALVVYQVWRNSYRQGMEIGSHLSVDALADLVLQKNRMHPVHHYVIHLWDKESPERALRSAALCGPAAANIAHMWHMSGHIYSDLHRYEDAVWQQDAAARVDHRMMMSRGIMPDQIHNYAHNSEWMCRNMNHVGRVREAVAVAKNMIEEPRIPRSGKVSDNPDQKWEAAGSACSLGRQRLVETLQRWELWDEVLQLMQTPYLEPGIDFEEQIQRAHLAALASFGKGEAAKAREAKAELENRVATLKRERQTKAEKAEAESREKNRNPDEVNKAMAEAMLPFTKQVQRLTNLLDEVTLRDHLEAGRREEALALRPKLREVPQERLAVMDFQMGKTGDAINSVRELAEKSPNQVHPQALLVDLLRQAGRMDEAKTEFQKLRSIAGSCDLDLPVLRRIAPVAQACECQGDWRLPSAPAKDLGERPPLDSLGPQFWQPRTAPEWRLADGDGKLLGSADFSGRPHVLIFFLGKGCAHCVQQLQAFEPKAAAFTEAGLPIVTVSTDSSAGVAETLKLAKQEGGFPFPILSDEKLDAFRTFDAFDDFEEKPLHGTFLIDGSGRIRWQHISYEPFMLPDFLLEEARRLLRMKPGGGDMAGSGNHAAATPAAR
ncbi:MAG: redoxin domain-containing protein [Verrucomicrobiales bacterium]|nr:redoxin domain-containing protein [Verrucomicrobiales bacterium]